MAALLGQQTNNSEVTPVQYRTVTDFLSNFFLSHKFCNPFFTRCQLPKLKSWTLLSLCQPGESPSPQNHGRTLKQPLAWWSKLEVQLNATAP